LSFEAPGWDAIDAAVLARFGDFNPLLITDPERTIP
jgi:hypothetical protein